MLVCPQCQFENPSSNRFCQSCGSPLKPLQAVLIPVPSHPHTVDEGEGAAEGLGQKVAVQSLQLKDWLTGDRYLDIDHRYQLQRSVDAHQILDQEIVVGVIDCQPGMASPLAQAQAALEDTDFPAATAALLRDLPPLAAPYLELQSRLFSAIPDLHAAWQQDNHTILILEDRSTWRSLADPWDGDELEPLEVVHWLYEMTELWQALTPWGGQVSLLQPENLCIDDDQILCLQRISYTPENAAPTLEALGHCWQTLLSTTTHAAADALAPVLVVAADLASGNLSQIKRVQEALAEIADQLQSGEGLSPEIVNPNDYPQTDPPYGMVEAVDQPDLPDLPNLDSGDLETQEPPEDDLDSDADGMFSADMISDEDLMANFPDTNVSGEDVDDTTQGEDAGFADLPTMALPMKLFKLDEAGRTHVGRQRDHNEDTFFAQTWLEKTNLPTGPTLKARGLYILCDGMGGHAGGEVASALAVSTLEAYFNQHWQETLPAESALRDAIAQANQVIFDKNELEGKVGSGRMGTTLVLVLLQDNRVSIAHVGDSRLYRWTRRQGLQQVTVDHEVGQREIQRGVEPAIAYARPDAYQLTQALGPRDSRDVVPSITTLEVMEDMLLILCSDGLSDNDLLEHHVNTHVEPLLRSRHDLEEGVSQLIDLANEHNGHDNITTVIVRLKVRPNLEALRT